MNWLKMLMLLTLVELSKTYYDAETGGIEGIIPIIAALSAGKNNIPNVNNLVKNRL